MSAINTDTDTILEALNDKADTDLQNIDTSAGGDVVVEWQAPTAANNYTWYRKYASGWVEQGGYYTLTATAYETINLPISMLNTNYFVSANYNDVAAGDTSIRGINTGGYTTTSFYAKVGVSGTSYKVVWEVKGMAAA